MSAQDPSNFIEWWKNLPIPWLVSGDVGEDEATANGTVVDAQVSLVKQATLARMPGRAPEDALAHIGGDRQLLRGPTEASDNYRTRLRTAWDDWARAGTHLELLVQLHWIGFPGAVIVQQNGLSYTLSGPPTAGVDPTSLLVIADTATLTADLTSSVTPGRSIPAGTPWWTFDNNTDFCSRFAILFPLGSGSGFNIAATAVFTATDTATVTWPTPFADTTYHVVVGAIYNTGGLVVVEADPTTKTTTGIALRASDSFTGTVDVLAWRDGDNPFVSLTADQLARLRLTIRTWRRAVATCVSVYVQFQGLMWGWPLSQHWGDAGLKWGGTVIQYSAG